MRHQTGRNSADRHGNALGRTVVEEIDDSKLMQESKHSLFADEKHEGIEHVHPYGFVNVPQKPTGTGKLRKAAEAFMSFMGGGRGHGVAMVVGDRRYRLYKLEGGEVALHDDQGHQVHIKRDGIHVSAPNSKKIVAQIMDDDAIPREDGKDMGQIKQAGRASAVNYTLTKDELIVNVPKFTVNANEAAINAASISMNGECFIGGPKGECIFQASSKTSLDDAGNAQETMLTKKVWMHQDRS
jgi:phage gp45-like